MDESKKVVESVKLKKIVGESHMSWRATRFPLC